MLGDFTYKDTYKLFINSLINLRYGNYSFVSVWYIFRKFMIISLD